MHRLWALDFRWLDAPVLNERGQPQHECGVTAQPGLYFLGLPWLHTLGDGHFSDIAHDALHPAERIDAYIAAEGETGAAIGIASEVLA